MKVEYFEGLKYHSQSQFLHKFIKGELYYFNYGSAGNTLNWTKSNFTNELDVQKYWKDVDEKLLESKRAKIEDTTKHTSIEFESEYRILKQEFNNL